MLDPLGPWALSFNLPLPDCSSRIAVTTTGALQTIEVRHTLRVVLRVDRGDAEDVDANGRRRRFDIIVEAPVVILDCRTRLNVLPAYASGMRRPEEVGRCPCDQLAAAPDSQPTLDGQLRFARLVAGAESPAGASPPPYAPTAL